ncbi:MAG TPA: HAD-IA family hydrolase [Clostridia bacterium]
MSIDKYRSILFDFDYTLADSSRGICECVSYALLNMGHAIPSDKQICKTIGLSLPEVYYTFTKDDDPIASDTFRSLFKKKADIVMTKNTVLFDEVPQTIEFLHNNNVKCGIVSTKYRYRILEVLKRDGLAEKFDIIVGGEDVCNPKPDPESLLKAIQGLGIKKEECLYIGDSIVDAKTAINAGVDFIGVLSGTTTREQFSAYRCIKIIEQLTNLIS